MATWENANEGKLAELILYVAGRIKDDPTGGATKINKILYFAEFAHVRSQGVPITGVPYQKLPRGPAPRRLKPIREQLIRDGAAVLQVDEYFGRELHRLIPEREPDLSMFSDTEIRSVDEVIDALRGKTAEEVSDLSHKDMAWELMEDGEDIPYPTAFLVRHPVVTEASRRHVRELADRLGLHR